MCVYKDGFHNNLACYNCSRKASIWEKIKDMAIRFKLEADYYMKYGKKTRPGKYKRVSAIELHKVRITRVKKRYRRRRNHKHLVTQKAVIKFYDNLQGICKQLEETVLEEEQPEDDICKQLGEMVLREEQQKDSVCRQLGKMVIKEEPQEDSICKQLGKTVVKEEPQEDNIYKQLGKTLVKEEPQEDSIWKQLKVKEEPQEDSEKQIPYETSLVVDHCWGGFR